LPAAAAAAVTAVTNELDRLMATLARVEGVAASPPGYHFYASPPPAAVAQLVASPRHLE